MHEEGGGEREINPWRKHQYFGERIQTVAIKRFGEQVSLLIISVNELKSKSTILNKLPNEVMSYLYVLSLRMLNQILRDVDGTGIVTVDGKMLLKNTVIMEEFLHP